MKVLKNGKVICIEQLFVNLFYYTHVLYISNWKVSIDSLTLFFIHASENQEKIQEEKQKKAQEKRDEARVLKEIEKAQKEMNRLDKYLNQQGSL